MMLNPAHWLLALVFGAFNFAFMGFATWGPTYYNQGLGLSLETASFYASLGSLAVIPSTIIAGRVLDRVKDRYLVMTVSLALSGILMFWCFQLGSANAIVPYTFVLSFVAGFVPTSTFTLAPETMPDPRWIGLALGIVSVGQNMGMFFGPPIVGNLIAGGNWAAGVIPLSDRRGDRCRGLDRAARPAGLCTRMVNNQRRSPSKGPHTDPDPCAL